jgi:hypothetical protein
MSLHRCQRTRQQPRALNLQHLLARQPTLRGALLRARQSPSPPSRLRTRRQRRFRPRTHTSRHYTHPCGPAESTDAPAPANQGPERRCAAEERELAASRRGEEREREREMHQQAADASRHSTPKGAAHPRHVSPYRNHVKPSSLIENRPGPLPNQNPASARSQTTKWHGPNQTLCSWLPRSGAPERYVA